MFVSVVPAFSRSTLLALSSSSWMKLKADHEETAGPMPRFTASASSERLLSMGDDVVDLDEKFSLFSEHWAPKAVATLNDYEVKVVKVKGDFVWHTHEDTDELFLVVDGELTIQLRAGDVVLGPGQLFVVPKGVEHCPRADGEVKALLIEPIGVVNTGEIGGELTAVVEQI